MGIGVSIFFIAVGAILAFGINAATNIANIDVIGFILMGVGALGLLISMTVFGSWRRPTTVVEEPDTIVRRREYPAA